MPRWRKVEIKKDVVKLADGLTVRKEINRITDKFNISVSNPCNILDQQTAGTFLQLEAQDKYNFFMKATDLETIEKDLDRLSALIPRTNKI